MKTHSKFLAGLIFAFCISGNAEAETTACNLLRPADIQQITGEKFSAPQSERLDVCGGLCASTNGWGCSYSSIQNGQPSSIYLSVYYPPFERGNWLEISRDISTWDRKTPAVDVNDAGAPAIWLYREGSEGGYGVLNVVDTDKVHLVISEENVSDEALALSKAKAVAQLVLGRLRKQ